MSKISRDYLPIIRRLQWHFRRFLETSALTSVDTGKSSYEDERLEG